MTRINENLILLEGRTIAEAVLDGKTLILCFVDGTRARVQDVTTIKLEGRGSHAI